MMNEVIKSMELADLLPGVREAVAEAGAAIMGVYEHPSTMEVEAKRDDSPVTRADLESNRILESHLRALAPDIAILSEETEQAAWVRRKDGNELGVLDPLVGTRAVIDRNGPFTVNVKLGRDDRP